MNELLPYSYSFDDFRTSEYFGGLRTWLRPTRCLTFDHVARLFRWRLSRRSLRGFLNEAANADRQIQEVVGDESEYPHHSARFLAKFKTPALHIPGLSLSDPILQLTSHQLESPTASGVDWMQVVEQLRARIPESGGEIRETTFYCMRDSVRHFTAPDFSLHGNLLDEFLPLLREHDVVKVSREQLIRILGQTEFLLTQNARVFVHEAYLQDLEQKQWVTDQTLYDDGFISEAEDPDESHFARYVRYGVPHACRCFPRGFPKNREDLEARIARNATGEQEVETKMTFVGVLSAELLASLCDSLRDRAKESRRLNYEFY